MLFSVVLSYELHPALQVIDAAHAYVLSCVQQAIAAAGGAIAFQGTSDLTWQGRKFSGNSMRCKRRYLLYHGTLLYDFDLSRIDRYLLTPPREPSYRGGRTHRDFVTNLPVDKTQLLTQLPPAFGVESIREDVPEVLINQRLFE